MDWLYQEFGSRLREARKKREFSQAYVAETVGLSRTSITNIERGRQRFPLHVAYQLAEAVRVDPKALLPEPSGDLVVPAADIKGRKARDEEFMTNVIRKGRR